jgi:hypothetical protein
MWRGTYRSRLCRPGYVDLVDLGGVRVGSAAIVTCVTVYHGSSNAGRAADGDELFGIGEHEVILGKVALENAFQQVTVFRFALRGTAMEHKTMQFDVVQETNPRCWKWIPPHVQSEQIRKDERPARASHSAAVPSGHSATKAIMHRGVCRPT